MQERFRQRAGEISLETKREVIDPQAIPRQHARQGRVWFFILMGLVSFLLHALWEMLQMAAYRDMAGRPFFETAARCIPATLGDVLLTFWIYSIGALAANNLVWGLRPRWNVYLTLSLLGAIHAIWIEEVALRSGRWSYTNKMPLIPYLQVGVWPVLQLLTITPLTIGFASRFALRRSAASQPDETSKRNDL